MAHRRDTQVPVITTIALYINFHQIASAVEEVTRFYIHLNSYQRLDARDDVPIVVTQMLSIMSSFSDVTVLSACLRFLSVLFEDHSDAFSLSVDLILIKLLVRHSLLFMNFTYVRECTDSFKQVMNIKTDIPSWLCVEIS